jgi:predicted PurR-regulated permease PerM
LGSTLEDSLRSVKPWVTFAGATLIIAILYFAQAVLVPLALAILITFVLAPPVTWLQRWMGRVPAVLFAVALVFALLGLAGWGLTRQLGNLAEDLPRYRDNIRSKIADVRGASRGGTLEKMQEAVKDIQTELGSEQAAPRGTIAEPLVVTSSPAPEESGFAWLSPLLEPLGTAGLVVALVIFMLLERRDLRDRLVGLIGRGRVATTTRGFDEASSRVSRYLLMQSLVSVIWGVIAFGGMYLLAVPYPFVWAILGAALRFIPYVGPWLGAGLPVLISLASMEGWRDPLIVFTLFVALELFTNLVLETVLYADAAGVSQVALLVSVAFWTWMWGPLGLLMASPLTVCLVVLGKYVPGLAFIGTMMADTPALTPDHGYYQRLLARDQSEAAELIENHVKNGVPETVYDTMMLPALNYAERDRLDQLLTMEEEALVVDATRELIDDAAEAIRRRGDGPELSVLAQPIGPREPLKVLGYAVNGGADEAALAMLAELLDGLPIAMEITASRMQATELTALVRERNAAVLYFADLPPSPSSKTRYLVKRLHAALPNLHIAVGRWAPEELADESTQPLLDAGADHVATQLVESRKYLDGLLEPPRLPVDSETAVTAGAVTA